jgi:hypothetical protein
LLDAITAGDSRDFFLSKLMARGKADFTACKDAYKAILRDATFPTDRLADLNTALDTATSFGDFQAKAKKLPKEWETREAEAARVARNEQLRADEATRQAEERAKQAPAITAADRRLLSTTVEQLEQFNESIADEARLSRAISALEPYLEYLSFSSPHTDSLRNRIADVLTTVVTEKSTYVQATPGTIKSALRLLCQLDPLPQNPSLTRDGISASDARLAESIAAATNGRQDARALKLTVATARLESLPTNNAALRKAYQAWTANLLGLYEGSPLALNGKESSVWSAINVLIDPSLNPSQNRARLQKLGLTETVNIFLRSRSTSLLKAMENNDYAGAPWEGKNLQAIWSDYTSALQVTVSDFRNPLSMDLNDLRSAVVKSHPEMEFCNPSKFELVRQYLFDHIPGSIKNL